MGNNYNGIYNFEVTNCGTINLNLIVNNISCNYWNDGNALVSPTGGTAPYTLIGLVDKLQIVLALLVQVITQYML